MEYNKINAHEFIMTELDEVDNIILKRCKELDNILKEHLDILDYNKTDKNAEDRIDSIDI